MDRDPKKKKDSRGLRPRLPRNRTETLVTQAIYDRRTSTESNLITFFGSSGQRFGQIVPFKYE